MDIHDPLLFTTPVCVYLDDRSIFAEFVEQVAICLCLCYYHGPDSSQRMLRSLRRLGDAGLIGRSVRTRTHATAIATAGSELGSILHAPSSACYVSERLRAKNVLRALADLLPRILEPSVLEREGWSERISNAVERLDTEPFQPSVACEPD